MPRPHIERSGFNVAVALTGTIAVLYIARAVFIPFSIALTLAFVLTPLVRWLQSRRVPKVGAVIVVMTLSTCASGALAWALGVQIVNLINDLPQYRQNINGRIKSARIPNGPLRQTADNLKELGNDLTTPVEQDPGAPVVVKRPIPGSPKRPSQVEVVAPPRSDWQYLIEISKPILAPIGDVGLVFIFTVFMLIEKVQLRNRLLRLAGVKRLNQVTVALDDAAKRVSKYLLMQFLVNMVFGCLFALGLWAIGIPNAALWGTLVAILRIVPYVGSFIGAIFPLILSLAIFPGWLPPAMVAGLAILLELVTGNVVEPWLYGAHTGISPLAILVTTVFWTLLWGPAGLILSTPLTVCVGVLGRYFPQLSFLHILIGDEPVLEPPALFYQRLLALDQLEARDVAELFLKEHSLVSLYDAVFMPALAMAERDRREGSLSQQREQFILFHLGELINEVAESHSGPLPAEAVIEEIRELDGKAGQPFAGRVFCLSADDEADSLAASMLVHVLERSSVRAVSLPAGGLLRALHGLRPSAEDVICVSALYPFSSARGKALASKLQVSFPLVTVLLGRWGANTEGKARGLEGGAAYQTVISLESVLETLSGQRKADAVALKTP